VLFFVGRLPTASGGTRADIASHYKFSEMPIAMPPGYQATRTDRKVNPNYYHLRAWISSVGASVAINDLAGTGRSDAMCLVDTRSDQVVVTYTPTAPLSDQFTPFILGPGSTLPMDSAMAPMGCTAGDFNGDGRMDLLVNYWGRTPILYLARPGTGPLSSNSYEPVEVVPQAAVDGRYHGPRWNTNALNVGDFDGTGHPSILVTNYFPDSDVLNPHGQSNVQMNSSMSNAKNGGGAHMLRWVGATSGTHPTARFQEEPDAIPFTDSTGWTLAVSSADLTGEGKPDLYIANDFGKDHLLYNASTPGHIRFTEAVGERTPTTPKSFVMGMSSFKGMGVDFGDMNHNGKFDMVVSNITTAWGLEESNFAWINHARDNGDMRRQLSQGTAPFTQDARPMGLAWTGWGWDVKMGDFLNDGNLEVVQAEGFVKGKINRWPWLQEMAMTNDDVYSNPLMWPDVQPGDDIAGSQPFAFYAKDANGKYQNIDHELGMAAPIPTRGIAIGDTRGTGVLDFAVARQWGPPVFYANDSPNLPQSLDLHLYRPAVPGSTGPNPGPPAYGATVTVRTSDGRTQISQLDGGGGHSGKRDFDVHFGLGTAGGPVSATVTWRDAQGRLHRQTVQLTPGQHTLLLDDSAKEVPSR
jgi:hypothetical protein